MKCLLLATALAGLATAAHAQAGSNSTAGNIACDKSKVFNTSSSGITNLISGVAGKPIYICGYGFFAGGSTAAKFISGTEVSTPCDTGAADILPAMPFTAQTGFAFPGYIYAGLGAPAAAAVCLNNGSAAQITGFVEYAQ
jgi:hypothetical protein